MAITASIIDYVPGTRNFEVYVQLVASGSYIQGTGDTVNLASGVLNPNGLEIEGFFETPIVAPSIIVDDLYQATAPTGGYFATLQTTGKTLSNYGIHFYAVAGGAELASAPYPASITNGTIILAVTRRAL